jgi:hypothetical protein
MRLPWSMHLRDQRSLTGRITAYSVKCRRFRLNGRPLVQRDERVGQIGTRKRLASGEQSPDFVRIEPLKRAAQLQQHVLLNRIRNHPAREPRIRDVGRHLGKPAGELTHFFNGTRVLVPVRCIMGRRQVNAGSAAYSACTFEPGCFVEPGQPALFLCRENGSKA